VKITIWIRASEGNPRNVTLRTDAKYERRDTPKIVSYGRKLVAAIERGAAGEVIDMEGEK